MSGLRPSLMTLEHLHNITSVQCSTVGQPWFATATELLSIASRFSSGDGLN